MTGDPSPVSIAAGKLIPDSVDPEISSPWITVAFVIAEPNSIAALTLLAQQLSPPLVLESFILALLFSKSSDDQ
jgi:hypothetical protein